ncbi:MAG TPA: hypothetical protein VFW66_09425 [Gemmatimonadales bacterium]|nr:hypothetical protein [Gemmatimonadales bacterium]
MSDDATVPAALPLSLLEAIRNLDTPMGDGLEALADEMVTRRLGLSATVAARIARYRELVARDEGVPEDDLVSVLRLVGRRADSALAFADAGRRAARHAVHTRARTAQRLARTLPRVVGGRIAARAARRLIDVWFGGALDLAAGDGEITMANPVAVTAMPDGGACAFYGAAFNELLRCVTGFEGAVFHEACRGRGDAACVWRAHRAGEYE